MSTTIVTMKEANVLWSRDAYNAAPNHVRLRLKSSNPTICVDATNNTIVAANEAWQDQCGFREEAIGASPKILQGDLTDQAKAQRFTKRAMQEGKAGTSLVNYKADGSPFLHTIVADRIGGFFIAKTTRAVDVPAAGMQSQLLAIAFALILTHALVLVFSALSALSADKMAAEATSGWGYGQPSIFVQPAKAQVSLMTTFSSFLVAEAIPLASLFLLAFFVVAMDDASAAATPDRDPNNHHTAKNADRAVFDSLLLGLPLTILAEAPSIYFDESPMKPALALSVAASLAAGRVADLKDGARQRQRRVGRDEISASKGKAVPVAEIAITTAACMLLVVMGPLQAQ